MARPMTLASVDNALFTQEFLQRLERLNLLARQLVRGPQRADRRASHRGVSAEFAEYRPYSIGDDARYIDWNAYARWRHIVVKLFVEEHDLPVYLLLDCTASMQWGEPDKFDYARQVVAGLTYIGLAGNDRVGIVPIGSERARSLPAVRGRDRFWSVLRALSEYGAGAGAHSLDEGVRRWLLTKPRRGMAVWITDLWGDNPNDAFLALDRLRYSRHEVGVIQITDEREGDAGSLGEYVLESVESGSRQPVVIDQRIRREYRELYERYQEDIHRYCRRHHLPLLQVDTRLPVPDLLMRVLREKGFLQ